MVRDGWKGSVLIPSLREDGQAVVSPIFLTWTVMVMTWLISMKWAPGRHGLNSAPALAKCVCVLFQLQFPHL